MRRVAITAVICAGLIGLLAHSAVAATPAPAWTIEVVPYPSAFEAGSSYDSGEVGPAYLVQVYNVGGASTTAPFTVTASLPKGLLPAVGFPPAGLYGPQDEGNRPKRNLTCSAVGRKITCAGGSEGPVGPGEAVAVVVPVKVEPIAAGAVVAKASIAGGGASPADSETPTVISAAPSPFGFIKGPGTYGNAFDVDGSELRLAGSHPYQMTVAGMNLAVNPNTEGVLSLLAAGGGLREAKVELPRGTVVDPQAADRCRENELESGELGCPAESQVGTVALDLSIAGGFGAGAAILPLYNMMPPPGHPAELGFEVVEGSYVHLLGGVSSDGSFTLTAESTDVLARVPIGGVRATLWGEPSAQAHDNQRGDCLVQKLGQTECPVQRTRRAFLTLPAACSGPLTTVAHIQSWLGESTSGSYSAPQAVEDCNSLKFEPTIEARATAEQTDSPSGLNFGLRQTQNSEFEDAGGNPQRATAPLENTTVTLPPGMVLNPSAANGRAACGPAQIGLATAGGQVPIRYLEEPARCPNESKVGVAQVTTPLLDHPMSGAIYLAKPLDNPFGSLLAIYLVIEDEESGIIAKLAGKVEPDPRTGQISTTFTESPELPLEDVHLEFFAGSRAALTTPLTCGTKTTTGLLTPWSGSNPTPVSDSFQVTSAPGGGSCPDSEAAAPDDPGFSAGTLKPVAGSYSPFVLHLARDDGSQRIERVDTTLPEGLTGRLAGIPYCSEAQIGQAQSRSHPEEGKVEQQDPSCPFATEVGTVTVGAGSGPDPVYVTGHAYLAGPYKGAPLSMVIITPAVTGPFDLGVVVVRVALEVDLETSRIHAVSDPLPTILQGIPLDVRSIALSLDRHQFILNPTNCSTQSLTGSIGSPAGSAAMLSERFGIEGCSSLGFKPKLAISLKGGTKRAAHPALKAVVTYPKQGTYANIASAQVALPHSEFLDQGNLNKVCTRPELRSDTCPRKSIYGHAKAWTPLLDKPLEGPVYLGVGFGYKLPALVADLNGQVRILLKGKVDTTKQHGIRNTFEAVPDAPVSRFVLEMKGGKKYGLLENSENICRRPQRARARFAAQNGRVSQLTPLIANSCKRRSHKHKHKAHNQKSHGRADAKK